MSSETIARQFLIAFASRDTEQLESLLDEDVTLRAWTVEGLQAARPQRLALELLAELAVTWRPATLEVFREINGEQQSALDFRIQGRDGLLATDQNGAAFVDHADGKITCVELHLPAIGYGANRDGIIPAALSDEEKKAAVRSLSYRWDVRNFYAPGSRSHRSTSGLRHWSGIAHPGSNQLLWMHLPEEEADQRIQETIEWFRERGMGFQWTVGPWDEPADLGERLLRHGFLRAGDQAVMLRFGLDNLDDIAINPDIEVVDLKERPDLWEASLQINGVAFKWPPEMVDNERDGWFEDLKTPIVRSFMALLDGVPVADGHLYLQSGVAYLGGAATLPDYRSRKIYSTLLRRRLEQARSEGYEVAMIISEPMSRRVVSKFGFEVYAMSDVYGWMDPMDPEVIKSLVVDD